MRWHEAIRLSPLAARFLLSNDETIRAMENKVRLRQEAANGVSLEKLRREAKERMKALRRHFTGTEEFHKATPRYPRDQK